MMKKPSRMENRLIVNKVDKIVNICFLKHFCESTNDILYPFSENIATFAAETCKREQINKYN